MSEQEMCIEVRELPNYFAGLFHQLEAKIGKLNRRYQYMGPIAAISLTERDGGLYIEKPEYPALSIDVYIESGSHSARIEGRKVDGPVNRRVSRFTEKFDLREGIERVAEYILHPIVESYSQNVASILNS